MIGYEFFGEYWWIFPLVMIFCCLLIMRKGCGTWACGCNGKGHDGSSLHILNRRYAKGEIDSKEYEKKKRAISTKQRS